VQCPSFFSRLVLNLLLGSPRNRLQKETRALIEEAGFPYFITSMGKGSVSEHLPTFGGIYGGAGSFPKIQEIVESSDCVLWIGNYPVRISRFLFAVKISVSYSLSFNRLFNEHGLS